MSLAMMGLCAFTACSSDDDKKGSETVTIQDSEYDAIINQYVDAVVLPTYSDLKTKNSALYDAVVAFGNNPSNAGFSKICEAWLTAREPWESSEAFLFGPVADYGLDPNMDSWPLDQETTRMTRLLPLPRTSVVSTPSSSWLSVTVKLVR